MTLPTIYLGLQTLICMSLSWPLVLWVMNHTQGHRYSRKLYYVVLFLILYCALLIFLAFYSPEVILILSVICGLFLVTERWHARSTYGTRKKLPPGSLSPAPSKNRSRDFYLKEFSKHGPIVKTLFGFNRGVNILGLDRGMKLLAEHYQQLKHAPVVFDFVPPDSILRFMCPANHEKYRPILKSIASPDTVNRCRHYIDENVQMMCNGLSGNTNTEARSNNLKRHLKQLVFDVLAYVIFGIGRDHKKYQALSEIYSNLDVEQMGAYSRAHKDNSHAEIVNFIAALKKEHRSTEVAMCFFDNWLNSDRDIIDDDAVRDALIYMVAIGTSDLGSFLKWLIKMMTDNPSWVEALQDLGDDKDSNDQFSLPGRFIKETLRLAQSEHLTRQTTEDIYFQGYLIPKNWIVRIRVWESHRDGKNFENPDVFNPDRFKKKNVPLTQYAPLGLYKRFCIGHDIINSVGCALIMELARNYKITVLDDGPVEQGAFHWQPNSRFSIQLEEV